MRYASDYAAHIRKLLNGLTAEGILTRQSNPIKIWIAQGNNRDHLYKPEHHLHVCWRLPHFPAPPITLLETLDFIRINFYSPYRQRLVGQSLTIQI